MFRVSVLLLALFFEDFQVFRITRMEDTCVSNNIVMDESTEEEVSFIQQNESESALGPPTKKARFNKTRPILTRYIKGLQELEPILSAIFVL